MDWRIIITVAIGGGLGAALRASVGQWIAQAWPSQFPLATFTVNFSGSILIGLITGLFMYRGDVDPSIKLFLITGLLGGFTTFSSFSLEAFRLLQEGKSALALSYVFASVVFCISGAAAGFWLARNFN
ncbi:MAG: fluoride efflux transporter CrcB [Pseudomonadota bacterium]